MEFTCHNPARQCTGCDVRSPLFCLLSVEELELVNRQKISVTFKRGETIRKQETRLTHVIVINSGFAKQYLEGSGRQNAIIRIVKPTNFIGGPGIYVDQLHHFSVTALTETGVCYIDLEVFKSIIDRNKAFRDEFLKDVGQTVLSVYNRMINITQKQRPGRMADTLLYLADEIFQSTCFTMVLSRNDLAELSTMSRDSAIRILGDFQNEGTIRFSGSDVEILDPDRLRKISRFG